MGLGLSAKVVGNTGGSSTGGVTSIIAGTGISVDAATGDVTVTNTGAGSGDMLLAGVQTVTGAKTFGTIGGTVGKLILAGSTSGSSILNAAAVAGATTITLPNANSTLPVATQQLTFAGPTAARTITLPDASITVARTDAANTFTGVQTMTSPVFVTPALGTPASGVVTNLTGTASININGTVGATTPGTGAFTTVAASGAVTLTAAVPQLVLGANTTTKGGVKMFGNTSGDVTISPLAVAGTATALTVPAVSGGLVASVTAIATVTGTPSSSNFLRGDGTWATPAGSGTVTVVGAGSLTSTALVTGGGTTTVQTPAATATLDSSGNISTPGSISTGVGGSVAGALELGQGTAPTAGTTSIKIYAPASVTSYIRNLPAAAGTGFYLGTNSAGVVTDTQVASTGSGSVALATSPTLVTPVLGTPSSGTLTSCTGLPVSTGISGLGTGVATWLATPTSANLAAALTDETGTGANVFATSPTLVTPVLGTPSSGTLSACTVDGTNLVGFRGAPQNSQSAAYTTVLADAGKSIFHPVGDANARTFTIDSNANVAYVIGTIIEFLNMSASNVTIAITSDTMTLLPAGTTGSRTLAQYGRASAEKITSTSWIISGNSALT